MRIGSMDREPQRQFLAHCVFLQGTQYGGAESLSARMRHERNIDQPYFLGAVIDDHPADGFAMMLKQQLLGIGISVAITYRLHVLLHGDQRLEKGRIGREMPQILARRCVQAPQKFPVAIGGGTYGEVVEMLRQRVHVFIPVSLASWALVIMPNTHITSNAMKEIAMTLDDTSSRGGHAPPIAFVTDPPSMATSDPHDSHDPERLRKLTLDLLDPAHSKSALIPQATALRQMLERRSALPGPEAIALGNTQTLLESGLAISPIKAALCARECFRTIAFIKGLGMAISEARRPGRAVRVLYAGCGPFATLALPLMSVLSSQDAVFTLIDIHEEALSHARQLIDGFGLSSHVARYARADAARYRIPAGETPDVIVSETMNASLRGEPQVAIARHLMAQAPEARMVPANVSVEACLLHLAREYAAPVINAGAPAVAPEPDRIYLGTVFELNAKSIRDWAGLKACSLPAACIRIPASFEQRYRPMLLTRIDVYGDSRLLDHESSLNLPQPFPGKPVFQGGEELQFRYRLGSRPGLEFELVS